MPAALDAAGLTLKDIGLVDMHEAFVTSLERAQNVGQRCIRENAAG